MNLQLNVNIYSIIIHPHTFELDLQEFTVQAVYIHDAVNFKGMHDIDVLAEIWLP